jgi:hypothetical protein
MVNEDYGGCGVGFRDIMDFQGAEFESTLWQDIVTVLLVLGHVEAVGEDCVGFAGEGQKFELVGEGWDACQADEDDVLKLLLV